MADTTTTTQHPTRSGACLCGGIQFELTGDPFTFALCHCDNCRKSSGTSFEANLFFQVVDVKIVDEQKLLRSYNDSKTNSGRTVCRQFCGECGSTLFRRSPGVDVMTVASGAVPDTTGWDPKREFFYGDRKKWLPEIHGTERAVGGFQASMIPT